MTALRLGALVIVSVLGAGCATGIEAGKVGLFVNAGSGLDHHPLKEGLYWHWPWNHVIEFDTQWHEYEEKMHVLTQDDVHLLVQGGIAIRPKVSELAALQEDLGTQYYETVVQSAFFTATRTVIAHYNMVDLPENSEKIENEIREHVAERISMHHLELGRIALQHIDYPASVEQAIEARLVTQQRETQKDAELRIAHQDAELAKIKAESDAATAKIDATSYAETAKIRAEGDASAQAMLAKTLTPLLVELRALTNEHNRLVYVPEGKQLSVVLEGASGPAAAAAASVPPSDTSKQP